MDDLATGFRVFFSFFSSKSAPSTDGSVAAPTFDFRPLLAPLLVGFVSLLFVIGVALALATATVGGLKLRLLGCSANRTRFIARPPAGSFGLLSSCSESVLGRFCPLQMSELLGTAVISVLGLSGVALEAVLVGGLMDEL